MIRPARLPGSAVGVSPMACLLNISGARRLYHTFAFHLSLIFRAAARDFFSAIEGASRGVPYLRVVARTRQDAFLRLVRGWERSRIFVRIRGGRISSLESWSRSLNAFGRLATLS